ncbi:MAG: lysophospholipid acyltransferase family protein [Terracidiphilus sp.]
MTAEPKLNSTQDGVPQVSHPADKDPSAGAPVSPLRPGKPSFTLAQRLVLAVVPRVVSALVWLSGLTWRFEVISVEGVTPTVFGERSPANIYCFWHQCVLPCTVYFRYSRAVILISRSFDGELVTRILRLFGFDAVRGSSSRGAREGLLGLARVIETGRTAIFTADGPLGPIYQTKMGPIKLAQMTGAPIGAFHLQPERAWTIRSWDRFLVPKPFTRICVSWGPWTRVPADLPSEDFERKRAELNAAIECARLRALDHFKKAPA